MANVLCFKDNILLFLDFTFNKVSLVAYSNYFNERLNTMFNYQHLKP